MTEISIRDNDQSSTLLWYETSLIEGQLLCNTQELHQSKPQLQPFKFPLQSTHYLKHKSCTIKSPSKILCNTCDAHCARTKGPNQLCLKGTRTHTPTCTVFFFKPIMNPKSVAVLIYLLYWQHSRPGRGGQSCSS